MMKRLDFGHMSIGAPGALLMQSHQLITAQGAAGRAVAIEPAVAAIAASG